MAAIDKIYGTYEEYQELKKWLEKNDFLEAISCMYVYETEYVGVQSISNFLTSIDKWLIHFCTIEWLQERLKEQYSHSYDDIKNGPTPEKPFWTCGECVYFNGNGVLCSAKRYAFENKRFCNEACL